jgi:hypothetical protein
MAIGGGKVFVKKKRIARQCGDIIRLREPSLQAGGADGSKKELRQTLSLLSAAKNLAGITEILRRAQNDKTLVC